MTRQEVARMLSSLPLGTEQLREVYDAVCSSSDNGYDEEYMMADLLTVPGAGVGAKHSGGTKASATYSVPIRSLIEDYLAAKTSAATKAGAADVQRYLDGLKDSDLQIYWPYSEDWDGETMPLITFDPEDGSETNYAYVISGESGRYEVTDSVLVNEKIATERPVWVINRNDDANCVPMESFLGTKSWWDEDEGDDVDRYNLYIRDFTMLRQYDPWFAGGSEFHVWCGGVNGFYATTEEELKNYTPSITDFVVVVKRSEMGTKKRFNAILVTDFSDQLDKLAFLISEDDGGTRTNWKCSASVKIKSKTYGFDIDIPIHSSDDIVWRGQLGATYFTKGKTIEGRFGDVKITFALE